MGTPGGKSFSVEVLEAASSPDAFHGKGFENDWFL